MDKPNDLVFRVLRQPNMPTWMYLATRQAGAVETLLCGSTCEEGVVACLTTLMQAAGVAVEEDVSLAPKVATAPRKNGKRGSAA